MLRKNKSSSLTNKKFGPTLSDQSEDFADIKQELLSVSGQRSTHSCVWLLSVGQSWRAACVHKTHSRRAWLQDPEPSSGVMTLTGPGLHQQPVAGLGLAWEWVSSQLHHRVTRDTWPQLRQLVVTQRGRGGVVSCQCSLSRLHYQQLVL